MRLDFSALKQALTPEAGRLTLTAETLPGAGLAPLLAAYNGNLPLILDGATAEPEGERVIVRGTASFLNATQLPVTGSFRLAPNGDPVFLLRFVLAGEGAGPNPWRFSTSFPQLPLFFDFGQSVTVPKFSLLDQLVLNSAAFVLTNAVGTDTVTGAPLAAGLNFAGRVQPGALLGLFDALIGGAPELLLYGPIVMPEVTTVTPELPDLVYPWQVDWPVPGLQLQAALGADWQLSKLTLTETKLRIYCPISTTWMEANKRYQPTTAVSGRLSIPSAKISVEVAAQVVRSDPHVVLAGQFTGVNLDNLSQLADLAGAGDLLGLLPDQIKEKLGKLSLLRAGVSLTSSLSADAVDYAFMVVGLPDVSWPIWPDMLTVGDLSATFLVSSPFTAARHASVMFGGALDFVGATFDITTEVPGFRVRADLRDGVTLPLNKLFTQYLPELPAPPDLSVNDMQLVVAPGQEYAFYARMADDPGWTLDLGPVPVTIGSVELALAKHSGAGATGSFGGTIEFAQNLELAMRYDLPGDFLIRATFPEVKLSQLIAKLNEIGIALPSGFDIALKETYVLVTKQGSGLLFTAATYVDKLGLLAFTAGKQGQWGFAAGVDLDAGGIASLPGLEPLAAFESFVGLDKLMLVVSTMTDPGFAFPSMAQFQVPQLADKSIKLPAQASGVVQGLNFYAQLNTAKSQAFRALARWLNLKLDGTLGITLAVSIPDPTSNSKLFLAVDQEIYEGLRLRGELGGLLQGGEVGAFVSGLVNTEIQGQPAQFDVTAAVLANGVMVSGTAKGTFKFETIQLSNLGLVVGMDWEGIPSLGVAGTLDIGRFDSSLALFFDSTQPGRSMVAGAISGLTLADVAATLAGQQNIPAELSQVLGLVGLKEISSFQMPASEAANLNGRNLSAVAQAFQSSGKLSIPAASSQILLVVNEPGQKWHLTDMTTMTHYSLTAAGDKIAVGLQPQLYVVPMDTQIGTLSFKQGFHIEGELDYLMLQARVKARINTSQGIAADAYVAPITIYSRDFFALTDAGGEQGPLLSLATYSQPDQPSPELRSPHFLLSSKLRLLGLDISNVYVNIGSDGLHFKVAQQVSPLLHLDLNGHFDSLTNLGAGGGIVVGLNQELDLGPLGKVKFNENVAGRLNLQFAGGVASATVDAEFNFAGQHFAIPQFALQIGTDTLGNIAGILIGKITEILKGALGAAGVWLDWVKRGIITGVDGVQQIAQVLLQVFRTDPAQLVHDLLNFGFGLPDVARTLQSLVTGDPVGIARILMQAGVGLPGIGEVLKLLIGDPTGVVRALAALGVSPYDIARLIQSLFGFGADQVISVLKNAGYGVDVLASVARDVFGMGADAVGRLLSALGLPGGQIAEVLKNVFGWSADQVASFMKGVLGFGGDAVNGFLQAAGYAADQINQAMKSVFDWFSHNLNPSNW